MKKILLVDDDHTMVSLLKTLLEMDGFEVAEANDWVKILDTIHSEMPDLVLMDYFLPQLEGLDILRELRAAAGLESVRVVMTSGMDVEDQCMQAGADAFLLKPYTPEQLMDCIQEQLGESPSGEGSPL